METITVQKTLNKENLRCSKCKEYLSEDIYQCGAGVHHFCTRCKTLNAKEYCPVCSTAGPLTPDFTLQDLLVPHITGCTNPECTKKIFTRKITKEMQTDPREPRDPRLS